jgi:hypothetical protein
MNGRRDDEVIGGADQNAGAPWSTGSRQKEAMRPRRSGHPVADAPWGIVPLKTCYGNPGGADATADAVLETSAAIETLCPTAQSSAGQAAGQEGS